MGQRGNLVRIAGGEARNHYTHWRARQLVVDLLSGPEAARDYVSAHERLPLDDLLDDVWGEGVVVLDEDRRFLLLAGDELHVPGRRLAFGLYGLTWPGWTVRWAYDGVHDLRTYLRAPALEREIEAGGGGPVWADEIDEDGIGVFTVRAEDGRVTGRALIWEGLEAVARVGPGAMNEVVGEAIPTVKDPVSGVHADVAARRVTWWADDGELGAQPWPAWAGWTVECAHDAYETQSQALAGAPFAWDSPEATLAQAISSLRRQAVARPPTRHPLDGLVESLRDHGGEAAHEVTVSAEAAAPVVNPGGPPDREAWFDALVDAWRRDGGKLAPVVPYDAAVDGTR